MPETDLPRVPWEELSNTYEFRLLTDKQKMFVCTYIANGYHLIPAVRTAYNCKSDYSAQCMSYLILRSPKIVAVLAMHFKDTPEQSYCEMLARDIRKGKITNIQLQAYKLWAEIKGWRNTGVVEAAKINKEKQAMKIANEKERVKARKMGIQIEPDRPAKVQHTESTSNRYDFSFLKESSPSEELPKPTGERTDQ